MNNKCPNIVLITCHDLGRFLGCYGNDTVVSPHIDNMAADGVLFERAFCTAPQCSPSRAGLFTGRYPHSNGVMGLTHGNFAWDLHPDERHLGQVLQEAGYTTALLGVHHESRRLASLAAVAERCGMDEIVGSQRGETLARTAADTMRRLTTKEQPFYMQIGFREPHRLVAKERVEERYMGFISDYITPDVKRGVAVPQYVQDTPSARTELAELQGAVRYMDACVGTILQEMETLGIEENTLVIFTTDHGLALPRAKCSLYDPGLEITLIMRLPGRGWRQRVGGIVSNIDIFPTIMDIIGLPIGDNIQGKSVLPLLEGQTDTIRDEIFGEMTYHDYYDPVRCIRTDRYKFIVNFSAAPSFMNPSQSWHPRTDPVVPANPSTAYHPVVELYDLKADPLERCNVADNPPYKGVRNMLRQRLFDWMQRTKDPLLEGAVTSPMHRWAVQELMD